MHAAEADVATAWSVKLASRRVSQSPWFLETRPRSHATSSNVLNQTGKVSRGGRQRCSSALCSQLILQLRRFAATTLTRRHCYRDTCWQRMTACAR